MFDIMKYFPQKRNSGNIAKERLRLLLVADRASCSPETLEIIRREVINVISKYIEIDKDTAIIEFEGKKSPRIFANIPIKEVRY